jgi:hypothetical protein
MTDPNVKKTVRIQLPVRQPAGKEPLSTATQPDAKAGSGAKDLAPSEFSRPADPPSLSPPLSASVMSAAEPPSLELNKETARIQLTPDSLPSAGQKKNAESVIPTPDVVPKNSVIAAEATRRKSSMLLSWVLLAVSALILIIQIWIYLS